MALLEVKNLSVFFKGDEAGKDICAASGVSFELNKGEILGIVGESGSGKSVTALSVLGLLPYPKAYHSQGSSIRLDGKELLYSEDLSEVRGGRVGFVFQEPMSSLNPLHTIEKQIAENLMLHRQMTRRQARKEVLKLLNLTGIRNARSRMKAYPYELSGGQRQRVMIAMAIANNPDILIADEPTTALDVTVQQQIIELLLDLRRKLGMAIIFISHDLQVVRKIADRVCVMKDGRIIESGAAEKIFKHPEHAYTKALIQSHNLLKKVNKISDEKILEVKNLKAFFPLKKNFWGRVMSYVKAVNEVSLSVHKRETLGIVGESGSGKSTLGLAIVGLNKAEGKILFKNQDVIDKKARKFIQIVFQDPYNSLNPRMNVEEIVGEGLEIHYPEISGAERKRRILKVLKEVGLREQDMYKYPHEFSGGQRQRIAIARALILEPEFLILDEPTSALDVTIQAQILKLLQEIQQQRGLSYIFISHDMSAIQAMADNVAVMKDGKIVEMGTREQIFKRPQNEYTKKLIAAC